jgi:hypothetical protein
MPFTFKLSQRLARMRSALRLFETASPAASWRGTPVVVAVQPGSVAPYPLITSSSPWPAVVPRRPRRGLYDL